MYSIISASVINIVPFIKAVDRSRNVFVFRYLNAVFSLVVYRKLSITSNLRTVLILLLLTVASMQSAFIADRSLFFLRLSERLNWVKFVNMPKQKSVMDLFSLSALLPHFRPRDVPWRFILLSI